MLQKVIFLRKLNPEKEKSTENPTKSTSQWIEDQFDLGYSKKW